MRTGRGVAVVAGLLCLAAAPGCSRKLSSGGGAMDTIFYDWFGMDRGTAYYYDVVFNAHEKKNFAYKDSPDPFLADKCVDAIRHLGTAEYTRLEGQVQVILLLSDVLIEDPVALAKDQAAGSLALLATRMPVVAYTPRPERGDRFLAQLQELDRLHGPDGRRLQDTPGTRQRVGAVVEEIGTYAMPNLQLTKDALRWFPTRPFVTQETDPGLREIYDRAMVRRSREVVIASLAGGVADGSPYVRRSSVMGLKTVGDAKAVDAVAERLDVESNALVRGEIAEYFGAVGGTTAASRLVALLSDNDGGVRHKAHLALQRLAGTDLGKDAGPWEAWVARSGGAAGAGPVTPVLPPSPPAGFPSAPPSVAPTVPPPAAPAPAPIVVPPPRTEMPPMPPPPPPPPPRVVPSPPAAPPPTLPPAVPGELPPPSRRSR